MKKQIFTLIQTSLLVLTLGFWQTGFSQVSISAHNTDFNTNFNGWNNTLPTGFTRASIGYVGTSASTTGGVYAVPNGGFGYRPNGSSATSCWIEGTFQNTTGSTITEVTISYQAFTISSDSRIPTWAATSSLGNVSALNWTYTTANTIAAPANKTVTLTGLNVANNGTFTVRFSADRGTGSGASPLIGLNNIKVRSVMNICNAPTGLLASALTSSSADLSWNTVSGSSGYQYVLDQTAANPSGAGTTTSGTTYNATTLTPSTTYYLHVRNNCGSGNFSSWTTISFTTPAAPACSDPTNLAENNVTATSSDFNWDAAGSNDFEYVLDQNATTPTGAGTPINGISYSTSTLLPSTTYYFHLRQDCGGSFSNWVLVNFTTPVAPCAITTGLNAANTTHNSSDLSWNAQGSNGFEYVLDQIATDPTAAGTPTTDTTYNPTLLTPLTTYYLHVRTDCGSGNFSPWTTISFTTLVEPCIAPTGLNAANTTHNSSDLSWNTQGSNGFEYVVDQTATDPTAAGTPTTDTTYNATGLASSTVYYLHVRTDCGSGNLSPWATISFTTLVEPCIAPTGLNAANTTHNSSDLSWNTQGSNGFEYVVDQTATNPTATGTPTTDTTYNATGLASSTVYYLHVRTDCGNGNFSPWTTISFTTLVEPCIAPTGLNAANTTHNSSDLSWNAQGSNGFEYVLDQIATDPTAAGTPTTDTTYNATGLASSTVYYLHVRTDCGNGNFSPWTTISFTTLATPCVTPTGLAASNITGHAADLSWNAQTGNTFEYIINQTASSPTVSGTATSNNAFAASTLTSLTNYYFHVRTDCGNGNFSPWTSISFTTLSTVGIEEQEMIDLAVYPNPANDLVTISGQHQGTVTISNLKGQQLLSIDLEQVSTIDVTNLESGIYFIHYRFENKTALVKLIKQ